MPNELVTQMYIDVEGKEDPYFIETGTTCFILTAHINCRRISHRKKYLPSQVVTMRYSSREPYDLSMEIDTDIINRRIPFINRRLNALKKLQKLNNGILSTCERCSNTGKFPTNKRKKIKLNFSKRILRNCCIS